MKKKILSVLVLLAVTGLIAGCQGKEANETNESKGENTEDTLNTGDTKETEDKTTLKVAASSTPHAEILEKAKELLKADGVELDILVFNDYVQPNLVVESGDFDANYFQHGPYLNNFNEEHKTNLVSAGSIHYEPLGIYAGMSNDLQNIKEKAIIAVPNDATNEARALLLLQENGVITLKEGAGITATATDIEENPYNIELKELEAAQIPRIKDEVDFVVLNGNYALEAGFTVADDAIAYEKSDSEAAVEYANVIAVKQGNENADNIKKLIEVLQSDEIKKFIDEKYNGAVISVEHK